MRTEKSKAQNGFTLVELLVVIAIIALLVSILLPALKMAREQAKFTICKTNQRQIGVALFIYADNYDDRLVPGDMWDGATLQYSGPRCLGHLLEGDVHGKKVNEAIPQPTSPTHSFYCPSDIDRYTTPLALAAAPAPHTFQHRWGNPGLGVIISYAFRDSLDGGVTVLGYQGPIAGSPTWLEGRYKGVLNGKVAKNAIVSDYLYRAVANHKGRFNILMGGGSVQVISDIDYDNTAPAGTWTNPSDVGLSDWLLNNWSLYGFEMDYMVFDAMDYIFGNPMWEPTAKWDLGALPLIPWR